MNVTAKICGTPVESCEKLDEAGQKYEIWKSGNLLLGENDTIWLVAR